MIHLLFLLLLPLSGDSLPAGQIVPEVKCAADASQSYALYLPSNYTPDREWPVILGFDPGGRGFNAVDRYQAAAEQYGYIVAGSNNSRNGSPEYRKAVAAMSTDVTSRFRINPKRIYTAGMSGGARVAFDVALSSPRIAGVFASSAGYPDGKERTTLPFPVFATAGTEDFNHLEMRQIDHDLTSPHHLEIFEGPHVWLTSELAMVGVEWMELQAMKSGIETRDEQKIDRIYAKRMATVQTDKTDKDTFLALQAIASDFQGLKDVASVTARATELSKSRNIRNALKKDVDEDDREKEMLRSIWTTESLLSSTGGHAGALAELRQQWKKMSEQAKNPEDSTERRLARRVLSGLGASITTTDPDYLKIIQEYRIARGRPN